MFIPFEQLPEESRVWIYQADRFLSKPELTQLSEKLETFIKGWESHGNELHASFQVVEDLFLIIALNERIHPASGCSIDKSVSLIKELEQAVGVNFFDRTKIALNNNQQIALVSLPDVKKRIEEGLLTKQTVVFNNLIEFKRDLAKNWRVPAEKTWLARYFR